MLSHGATKLTSELTSGEGVMALTATFVKQVKTPGRWGDGRGGHGLTLVAKEKVRGGLSKAWVQRIRVNGRETNVGLGSWPVVTLADARKRALENVRTVAAGGDPRVSDRVPSFRELAEQAIENRRSKWRESERRGHRRSEHQWRASLGTHAAALMDRPVDTITIRDVKAVLKPIWSDKPETARRVRQRIHAVMKLSIAEGFRPDNPAGEEVVEALGSQSSRQQHVRALHHSDVAAAITAVHASGAELATKLSLEFIALTACRPGEAYGCRWDEIDVEARTWTVPPTRTKTAIRHRVPLSTRAVEVLNQAREAYGDDGLVFPTRKGGQMNDGTIARTLKRLGIDCTPHGMRSSFRSWASDTGQSWEASEMALGHVVRGVAGAYQRSDLLEVRRPLMEEWSAYLRPEQP